MKLYGKLNYLVEISMLLVGSGKMIYLESYGPLKF